MDFDSANGIQYRDPSGYGDDDPAVDAGSPCAGTQPFQTDGAVGSQVVGNPGDAPSERAIELWAAVALPNGSATNIDVYIDVFYPDGNFKARIQADTSNLCDALGGFTDGTPPTDGSVMAAALETGQLDDVAVAALVHRCNEQAGAFASAQISLSVNEPCGQYRTETHALTHDTTATATGHFDVRCLQFVDIDTTQIHWGEIIPGEQGTVEGDWSMQTTDLLTVQNLGSGGANVGIRFARMVTDEDETSQITQFAAGFGRDHGPMTAFPGIDAGTDAWFSGDPGNVLCTAGLARIDVTALPGASIVAGAYTGTLTILTGDAGEISPCNNDRGIFGGEWRGEGGAVDNQRTAPAVVSAPPLPDPPPPPTTTTTEPPTTTTLPPSTTTSVVTTTTTEPTTTSTSSPTTSTSTTSSTTTTSSSTTTSTVADSTTTTTGP